MMKLDPQTRYPIAAAFFLLAAFVAMNHAAAAAPLIDWWLPLVLTIAGVALVIQPQLAQQSRSLSLTPTAPTTESTTEAPAEPSAPVREWVVEQTPPTPVEPAAAATPTVEEPVAEAVEEAVEEVAPEPVAEAVEEVAPEPAPEPEAVEEVAAPEPVAEAVEEVAPEPEPEPEAVAETAPEPEASGEPDDLTILDGVGPKARDALVAGGLDTYQKLANASEDDIRAALEAAGTRATSKLMTWSEQAGFAAKGDMDGLQKFIDDQKS